MTPYQKHILELAGIEFEDIQDEDVLTWYSDKPNSNENGWYYLYYSDGRIKEMRKGKTISLTERKGGRPGFSMNELKEVVIQAPRKRGRPRKHFDV